MVIKMGFFRMSGYQTGSNDYTIHNIHSDSNRDWRGDYYKIISIDPAVKNLAIRIEHRYPDGTTKATLFERNDFEGGEEGVLVGIMNYLNQHWYLMEDAHFVIVEKQLPFNYQAVRVSQHIISFFYMKCRNNSIRTFLIELNPQAKSRTFTSVKMGAKEVKKWAVGKAEEILIANNDYDSLKLMKSSKKKDDMADVVVQIEAFWRLVA